VNASPAAGPWNLALGTFSAGVRRVADWRLVIAAAILTVAWLPTAWLVVSNFPGLSAPATAGISLGPFLGAIRRSLWLMAGVAGGALVLGWPTGTLLSLVGFPGRRLLLTALAVPLFTPSFLWAIGLSLCRPRLAYRHQWWLDGFPGALLTGVVQAIPLVVFAALLAGKTRRASQLDAARLAGGFCALLKASVRHSLPAAMCGAVLGGVLALADPGPAQIMGYHGIASEILIAFSARYDAALAARKALFMGAILLPAFLLVSWKISVWSETHLLGRDLRKADAPIGGVLPRGAALALGVCCLLLLLPAFAGLMRPLRSEIAGTTFRSAWLILSQSAATTARYGLTAAATAVVLAVGLILSCGRIRTVRLALCLSSFLFLSLPPALHALGFAGLASRLPAALDSFTRGGGAVGFALGLRLMPIPILFCIWAWSLLPASHHDAAAVHGVPMLEYHWRVTLPQLWPTMLASSLLVALISIADVSSTLLLLPPGAATFTTRIFAVIDNTSERTLSALCVVYIAGGFVVLALLGLIESFYGRRVERS
jgi:ABC-type Fe3+ transport system permease subunit